MTTNLSTIGFRDLPSNPFRESGSSPILSFSQVQSPVKPMTPNTNQRKEAKSLSTEDLKAAITELLNIQPKAYYNQRIGAEATRANFLNLLAYFDENIKDKDISMMKKIIDHLLRVSIIRDGDPLRETESSKLANAALASIFDKEPCLCLDTLLYSSCQTNDYPAPLFFMFKYRKQRFEDLVKACFEIAPAKTYEIVRGFVNDKFSSELQSIDRLKSIQEFLDETEKEITGKLGQFAIAQRLNSLEQMIAKLFASCRTAYEHLTNPNAIQKGAKPENPFA